VLGPSRWGVALPPPFFESDAAYAESVAGTGSHAILGVHPAVITTAGDVAANVDLKHVNRLWEELRR
jgi:hypothetical protein